MNKKTLVNSILIILSLLLVVGMAIQFMPQGTQAVTEVLNKSEGTPAIMVNGKAVTKEKLALIEKNNPSPFGAEAGALQDDFRTYLISQVIQQELLAQAASSIDVTREDVEAEVTKVREQQGLTDNAKWTDALQRAGTSDSEYRKQVKEGLAVQRKIEEIESGAQPATEEEMRLYYDLNPTLFQSAQRLIARQIVVTDEKKAADLLAQARGGADFAKLATENSEENAERGGALGPVENGKVTPVDPLVLPTEVGQAATALKAGGITDVVSSGGKFYIVKVEGVVPPQQKPYEEVKAEIKKDLDDRKKAAALEAWMDEQNAAKKVEVVDPAWKYEDPVVAEVDGKKIPYSEVVGRVLQNQQLMMMMQSMPPEQLGEMINGMLKPSLVDQAIQAYAAPAIVKSQNLKLVGTRSDLANGLMAYGGRDAKVTEADLQAAYQERRQQFETPASAVISDAVFPTREAALAFRQDWKGGDFTADATAAGATVSERGQVGPTTQGMDPSVLQAIFEGNLRAVGAASLTDIIETDGGWQVVQVQDLKKAEVLPLAEVKDQLRLDLLNEKRASAGEAYLKSQVDALKPVSHLEDVLAAQKARVPAAPAQPAAGEGDAAGGDAATGEGGTPAAGQTDAPAEGTPAEQTPPAEGAEDGAATDTSGGASGSAAPTEAAPADTAPATGDGGETAAPAQSSPAQ